MQNELIVLIITAASVGFFHTLLGPDHYLPFIVMSKTGKWPLVKTAFITFICGAGHVMSSVALGFLGIALGIALMKMNLIESYRGEYAAWALMAFGFVYLLWGIRRAILNKPHTHAHHHEDGQKHEHTHNHLTAHAHLHKKENANITPWVLFVIFILGPCEPLIPILMYPAAKNNISWLVIVTAVFAAATIITMTAIVIVSSYGISLIPLKKVERYSHALAGATIFTSGITMRFLNL